jgi:hypothetical protein
VQIQRGTAESALIEHFGVETLTGLDRAPELQQFYIDMATQAVRRYAELASLTFYSEPCQAWLVSGPGFERFTDESLGTSEGIWAVYKTSSDLFVEPAESACKSPSSAASAASLFQLELQHPSSQLYDVQRNPSWFRGCMMPIWASIMIIEQEM